MIWPELIHGDALTVLRTMESESVHCCVTSPPYWGLRRYLPEGHPDEALQLGLEPTPEMWVENLVAVFREVRRVLRKDGCLFLNCGDAYAGSWGNQGRKPERGGQRPVNGPMLQNLDAGYPANGSNTGKPPPGLKPKDLIGLPWMLAFALRADGWWLRSAITWCKPAPMPESVTDRPTSATEMLFLFARSERYYYDQDAIREPHAEPWRSTGKLEQRGTKDVDGGANNGFGLDGIRPREYNPAGRNKRNWWVVNSESCSDAHFATFPQKLVEPCILAGTSERGCCPECGAPWERETERTGAVQKREPAHVPGNTGTKVDSSGWQPATRPTDIWRPPCAHVYKEEDLVPAVVLDPFAGSGTVGKVATRLGRRSIGIELNETYVTEIAAQRLAQGGLGL